MWGGTLFQLFLAAGFSRARFGASVVSEGGGVGGRLGGRLRRSGWGRRRRPVARSCRRAVFAKRAMAFSPPSTVTLSVSGRPVRALERHGVRARLDRRSARRAASARPVAVDGDLGPRGGGDLDPADASRATD